MTNWNPPRWRCLQCKTVIYSKYPGEWVSCLCGSIYVDYTRHYGRHGGDPSLFQKVEETDD